MIKLEVVQDYFWEELDQYDRVLNDYYCSLYSSGIDYEYYGEILNYCRFFKNKILYYKRLLYRLDKYDSTCFLKEEIKSSVIGIFLTLPSYENGVIDFQKRELNSRIDVLIDLYDRFYGLKKMCDSELGNFSLKDFLLDNSSLLHLVYANNIYPKIKKYSSDSYMFLCQFHRENTPSLGVTSYLNLYHCFGCGCSGTTIDYIMEVENLNYQEALSFLARIYMIDINYNHFNEYDERVLKYQNALLSEDFMALINSGLERIIDRDRYSNPEMNALAYYDDLKCMIERVKNGEKITFKKKKEDECVLKLELPFDKDFVEG